MRILLLILIFTLIFCSVRANMGEPVSHGTLGARPFTSQFVEITKEDLFIKINNSFKTAQIKAVYHIVSDKDGLKIPLLFYASDYQEDFLVKIDGKLIEVKEIPYEFEVAKDTKFKDFDYFFEIQSFSDKSQVHIDESETRGFYIALTDMKYFETDISKGNHIIEVSYTSKRWEDGWDWVNEYSFRYALSPAKYWKSFGVLNVELNFEDFSGSFETNLAEPHSTIGSTQNWTFNELPKEIILINYKPEISNISKFLLFLRPLGGSILFGFLLAFIHYLIILKVRLKNVPKKYNLAVIIGSIIVPAMILFFWIKFIGWTKSSLGEHAGMGIDGYAMFFIPILFYPLILLTYWVIMWQIDKRIKDNVAQRSIKSNSG